jgi:hypothetical protein
MTLLNDVVEASKLFSRAEEAFFADFFAEDLTDEQLARLWLVADEWRKTVDGLAKLIADEWVARGVWVEVDGFKVGHKKGYTRERCIDTAGFTSWAMANPDQLVSAVNPNNVRFGSLPAAVRDTFFEKETVMKPDAIEQPVAIPLDVLEAKK